MQVEHSFFVGIQDVGVDNRITYKALLEALTNMANIHGNLVGQGADDRAVSRLAWVVLNWKVEVRQRAKVCETILVRTWAQKYAGAFADRDYEVFGQDGSLLALATSRWAAVDIDSASIVRLTPELMDAYGCEPERQNFPGFRFQRVNKRGSSALSSIEFKVTKAMIDCNHHVHNPAYMDFAAEVLPEGLDTSLFDHLEISYKKEVKPGETVSVEYAREGEKHMVFVSDPTDGSLHAAIALY